MIKIGLSEQSIFSFSFNLISVSFQRNQNKKEAPRNEDVGGPLLSNVIVKYTDFKTLLGGRQLSLIENLESDLDVYLLIPKKKSSSSEWNLIMPIVRVKNSGKLYEFSDSVFALQGSGGGLGNTKDLISKLRTLEQKGYNITISPKVVESRMIDDFQYVDSNLTLESVLSKSVDLITYRKGVFREIYAQYLELISLYDMNHCV